MTLPFVTYMAVEQSPGLLGLASSFINTGKVKPLSTHLPEGLGGLNMVMDYERLFSHVTQLLPNFFPLNKIKGHVRMYVLF